MSMYGRLAELNNCHFQIIQAFKKKLLYTLSFFAMLLSNDAPKRLPVTLLGMTYPGPKTCNDDPL